MQLLAALTTLTLVFAAVWTVRDRMKDLPPLTLLFVLGVVVWAGALFAQSLAEWFSLLSVLSIPIMVILVSGQIVLASTIFILTFRGPNDKVSGTNLFFDGLSLFVAAGLVALLYLEGNGASSGSMANPILLFSAFLGTASVVRLLLRREFWKDPTALILLVAAGAAGIFAMQSMITTAGLPAYAASLLLMILAACGALLLRSRTTPDDTAAQRPPRFVDHRPLPAGDAPSPGQPLSSDQSSTRENSLRSAISSLPGILFEAADDAEGLQNALGALGQPLQAARVLLFSNETNSEGLLCLSLQAGWAADPVPDRQGDPQLQRLPYALSSLAQWQEVLAQGETVGLDFETPPTGDTLFSPSTRSMLLLPLQLKGAWIGLLALEHFDAPRHWSMEEKEQLMNAGRLLALAIRQSARHAGSALPWQHDIQQELSEARERNQSLQAQLTNQHNTEQQAEKRLKQLRVLNETTNVLLSTLDLETLLGRVLDSVCQAIPAAEKGTLHMIAPETGQLEMRAVLGFSDPRIHKHHSRARRGLLDMVITRKQPVLIEDLDHAPELEDKVRIGLEPDTRSVIAAPLIADQSAYGALYLAASRPHAFDQNDLHLVSGFATTATLAIRNAQLHEKVQKMAITDQLTTLYNRRGFLEFGERLFESARRFRHSLAIIALDIDYFKNVNDTYGHVAGDLVLQQLSEIVLRKIRKVDLVARLGGDEFTILLPETDVFQAMHVSERLRRRVESARLLTGRGDVSITISLGVSRMSTQIERLETLMDWADQALYESKQAGRNRVRMYPLETPMPDLLPPDTPTN